MTNDDESRKPLKAAAQMAGKAASSVGTAAGKAASSVASVAGKTAALVADLNGDGVIDQADVKIARGGATAALAVAAKGAGKLGKSVTQAPLTKDIATYAAVGAVVAMPLPIVGSAFGAAIGAGMGLLRNLTRHETLAPPIDPIAELERLHGLKEKGIITDEEFVTQKQRILK